MESFLNLRGIVLSYIYFQIVFQACILTDAKRDTEPNCYSRFDYEYKVVQKIVGLENECSKLHETNDELRTEIRSLRNKVEELSRARPSQKQAPPIAFLAVLHQQRLVVATKATIVFDTPVINLADCYSPSNGLFTAPNGGIYQFSASIMADNSGEVWAQFLLNGEKVSHIYARASDGRHDQGANTVVLQLKKGDTVCVQNDHKATIYGERYSSFSGVLLQHEADS